MICITGRASNEEESTASSTIQPLAILLVKQPAIFYRDIPLPAAMLHRIGNRHSTGTDYNLCRLVGTCGLLLGYALRTSKGLASRPPSLPAFARVTPCGGFLWLLGRSVLAEHPMANFASTAKIALAMVCLRLFSRSLSARIAIGDAVRSATQHWRQHSSCRRPSVVHRHL